MYGKDISIKEIDGARKHLGKLRKTLSALPSNLIGDVWQDGTKVRLNLPYNLQMLRLARRMLGNDWQFSRSYFYAEAGNFNLQYTNKRTGVMMHVTLEPTREGSMCRRVQVGEKTEPIYKVVCD